MHPGFLVSLRTRLLATLLVLTALPVLLIGGLAYQRARATIDDRVKAQLTSVADLKKEQIDSWLEVTTHDVHLLADNFLIEEHFTEILDPDTDLNRSKAFAGFVTDNLISIQKVRAGYSEILFTDTSGKIILSTDPNHVGAMFVDKPLIANTLASPDGEYIEDIHREQSNRQIEMTFAHVIHAVDLTTSTVLPRVDGVVIIRVAMGKTIYPLIRDWPGMGTTGETLLVRADGNSTLFLNPLRFNEDSALNLRVPFGSPNAKPAQLAAVGREGIIETVDYRGTPVLAAYRTIPKTRWGFVAKQDESEAFAPMTQLTHQWILVTVLVLLAAVISAIALAHSLTRPLASLVVAAHALAAGKLETDVIEGHGRLDEIGQLASAFQTMATAVHEREAELKTHAGELELLNQLGRDITTSFDLREIGEHIVTHIARHFDNFLSQLLLYDEEHQELVVYSVAGRGGQQIVPSRRVALGQDLPGQAALTRKTQCSDRLNVPQGLADLEAALKKHAEISIPILREDKLLGVLDVSTDHSKTFRQDDIVLLETLASQLAPVIENAQLFQDLSASYDYTLDALAAALDARDKETEGHSRRVLAYTLYLASRAGVPQEELTTIRRGALLHDIGKIGVPDSILLKPGPLTDEEWSVMRNHPEWGARILAGIPFLNRAAEIVRTHQERWDGKGYPQGLKGDAIPVGARLFALADALDAITSDRPYRARRSYEVARSEIRSGRGTQFDPHVVDIFLQIPEEEWSRLRSESQAMATYNKPVPLWAKAGRDSALNPEMAALSRLIASVSGSLDLDNILREAARTIVETLGAAACGLFLYDRESDNLTLAAQYGLPDSIKSKFSHFQVTGFHNEIVVREACTNLHNSIDEVPAFVELGLPTSKPDWGAYLCVPLTAKGEVAGIMGILSSRPHSFEAHDIALYRAIGEQIGLAITNARLHQSLEQLAFTDALTGAYNRRFLDDFLVRELQRCVRYEHGLSIIMLDIDNFNTYNDTYGHPAGDKALRQAALLLRRSVRATDVVGRYGGEEFLIVLPGTDLEGARAVAEKIRAAIEAYPFENGHLTSSLGVAHYSAASRISPEKLVGLADQALYCAKRKGRNAVSSLTEPVLPYPSKGSTSQFVDH